MTRLAPWSIAASAIPALIALAIIFPAIISPEAAFAQNVSCTTCTHEVSYFKGKGGLIAKAEGTAKEVTWVAQCGGVVRSGKLEANDDGIVSTLFDDDNNLACSTDDGRFRLGPVTDGGWFWITDEDNSAVGNLVNNDVLGNAATTLANAGEGVETAAGKGATFLKETATGRVGILPNILPVKPVPPTRKCGFTGTPSPGAKTSSQRRIATNCKLGDGGGMVHFTGPVGVGGTTAPLPNNTITRPYSGTITIEAKYFLNGSGHYVADPNGDPDLGWPGGSEFDAGIVGAWILVRPSPETPSSIAQGNISGAAGQATGLLSVNSGQRLAIAAKDAYCGTPESPKNNSLQATVFVTVNPPDEDDVVPRVVQTSVPSPSTPGVSILVPPGGKATVTIACPSAAAAREGAAPVLENRRHVE